MKAHSVTVLISFIILSLGTKVLGSGFRCTSDEGYHVKIFNFIHGEDGTRLPALFVFSRASRGTLIVAKGNEIEKKNLSDSVRYSIRGNDVFPVDWVIAQIRFKEGREYLERGETAYGNLILASSGKRKISRLICVRHIKQ